MHTTLKPRNPSLIMDYGANVLLHTFRTFGYEYKITVYGQRQRVNIIFLCLQIVLTFE